MARKMKTMDGNSAAAWASYAFTDVAAIYPITPSSVMADETDKYAAAGKKNLFGQEVRVTEMQSEAGAAGAVHGSLAAGALTTTYTASQGLLLMIPNMYKMAGELLPGVIHVSARTIAGHALSIFGDHSDIYSCRQTGYAMLASNNPQEVMDLTAVAHLSAIKGRVPFLHFFDGFRTSHEIQKIEAWDYDDLADMLDWDAVDAFRRRSLNPEHPVLRGTAQNDDIFFQAKEAANKYYDAIPDVVADYMDKVNEKCGTNYKPFNYYGAPDAEKIIIAMGSVCDTAEEVIDYLTAKGEKIGLVKVRLYRPFSAKHLLDVIPETVKSITVLDRTKEPGSIGEPLYLDVLAALNGSKFHNVSVFGGRYGLASKDTNPGAIVAIYHNMDAAEPKKRFTVGIDDDVTFLSLPIDETPDTAPAGTTACKFWGLGADGTVGANKNSIKIIGDKTDMYAQAYFAYDSKKSGGLTVSHLRFGHNPIKSTYYIHQADFVACHNPAYIGKYDMIQDLKPGGSFLLNCPWDVEELGHRLSAEEKQYLAKNNINVYVIDGIKIGKEIGLGTRINTVLQAAFFKIANIIPIEQAVEYMKEAAKKSYSKKGDAVVQMNYNAIDAGTQGAVKLEIPADWATTTEGHEQVHTALEGRQSVVNYVKNIQQPINAQRGNQLPVSTFVQDADGTVPQGTAAYEKRGIAVDVPQWIADNCIQCNICSYVCPHSVIRPAALTEGELAAAPAGTTAQDIKQVPGMKFVMTVSVLDCTGCGSCVAECPAKEKALVMKPLESQLPAQEVYDYAQKIGEKPEVIEKFKATTVKGSQFKQPLFEFSGACAGCGETPYAKLATQLFGDRMMIANATGCSSIWAGSTPSTPYTVNKEGKGPSWANSLFEDNAEFGLGMELAQKAIRKRLIDQVEEINGSEKASAELKAACQAFLDTKDDSTANAAPAKALIAELEKCNCDKAKAILADKDYLAKKSIWILGGDGWAYDIGFSGLDHAIATGEDINILVFDTEMYSNTGGQCSKSSQMGSVQQFSAAGKPTKKKDLPAIAMSYGNVYVAHIAMGADRNQCLKAFLEAEAHKGPSVIIAYAPCISHGVKGGLRGVQAVEKQAVAAGYWKLFRYDPNRIEKGLNPFQLDSKEPSESYRDFLMKEVRYNSLMRAFPERAEKLFTQAEKDSIIEYHQLKAKADAPLVQ